MQTLYTQGALIIIESNCNLSFQETKTTFKKQNKTKIGEEIKEEEEKGKQNLHVSAKKILLLNSIKNYILKQNPL